MFESGVTAPMNTSTSRKPVKLAFFVSHPIQYQVPLLRRLTQEKDLDVTAFFFSERSLRGYWDEGFKKIVEWDVPLLGGYKSQFLPQWQKDDKKTMSFFRPVNRHILKAMRSNEFDVVWMHGYATLNSLLVMAAAKICGAKVLLSADSNSRINRNSGLKETVKKTYMALVRSLIDGVLVIGRVNQEYWHRYFGDKVAYVPLPYSVDNGFFRSNIEKARKKRTEILKQYGLEDGRPVILFASKMQTRKRCIDLVAAYKQMLTQIGASPVPYLLIAGDGEERANVEEFIAANGLHDVRMLGFKNQSELPALYSICDVFVLPSKNEPWGLIINEVMNAGCAIVVTDEVGCQEDLVHNAVNGYVYRAGDVDALTDILRSLVTDADLRKQMGEASLRIIDGCSYEQDVAGLQEYFATLPLK